MKKQLISCTVSIIMIVSFLLFKQNSQDEDCLTAISICESSFVMLAIKRDEYKLVSAENDVIMNGDIWLLTYLNNKCLSAEGLRICKGGELFLEVNIRTKKVNHHWGE